MSNKVLAAVIPGLLAAGAMGARQMGYFGGDQKTPEQILGKDTLAANNKDWARFGHDPMQLPGAVNPSSVGDVASAPQPTPFQRPSYSPNFPLSQAPMQMPGSNAPSGAMPSNMLAALRPVNPMPMPQSAPGLLGTNEVPGQRASEFVQSQLHGTPMPSAPTMPTGGSATPQSNPFLYAQLYGNRGTRLN
jgi:hypothetical protein